jgi:hypothetical protein
MPRARAPSPGGVPICVLPCETLLFGIRILQEKAATGDRAPEAARRLTLPTGGTIMVPGGRK